jgi:hypothetical protein
METPPAAGNTRRGMTYEAAKADSIAFGTPDAHRAALASLVNLRPP